jgi:hypothetical protein
MSLVVIENITKEKSSHPRAEVEKPELDLYGVCLPSRLRERERERERERIIGNSTVQSHGSA